MTTFNRIYRAPKFHLCVHTGNEDHIGFEPSEYRRTQYTFVSYGTGTYHAFTGDDHDVVTNTGDEELLDFEQSLLDSLKINDKEVPEMTYVELKQNKIYNIDSSSSFVGLFEEGYA